MADEDVPACGPEAAQVRQIWSALGLPGMIDVHTHFMPKPVLDKVWHYFDSAGPLVGRAWPIAYRAEESDVCRHCDNSGFADSRQLDSIMLCTEAFAAVVLVAAAVAGIDGRLQCVLRTA